IKNTRVEQLKRALVFPAPRIFLDELLIRKLRLRVFVERLRVGMRRRGVEVEILLFHILAVISLRIAQTKKALFQNRVATIPKRQRKTKSALAVAPAEQAIFAPAIRAATRVVVREII